MDAMPGLKMPLAPPHAWLAGARLAGGDGVPVPVGTLAVVPVQRAQGLDGADCGGGRGRGAGC